MRKVNHHIMQYRILDAKRDTPIRTFTVPTNASAIQQLAENGFLIKRRLISFSKIRQFRTALSEVARWERKRGIDSTHSCFGSLYFRYLLDKHKVFGALFHLKSTVSIARAVLGPQVKFDEITARVTDLSSENAAIPWHIHLRVVPEPLPVFFAYPHAIECLLYLDDVDDQHGPLCVLPGSHRRISEIYPKNDMSSKPKEKILRFKAGDCLIMHSNLWHRALSSSVHKGQRRLLIFGYLPAWISGEERGPAKPKTDFLAKKRQHPNELIRELAGDFYWG